MLNQLLKCQLSPSSLCTDHLFHLDKCLAWVVTLPIELLLTSLPPYLVYYEKLFNASAVQHISPPIIGIELSWMPALVWSGLAYSVPPTPPTAAVIAVVVCMPFAPITTGGRAKGDHAHEIILGFMDQ